MKIVIKMGGDLLKGETINTPLINDIKKLSVENGITIVHGGGDIVTEIAKKLGKEQMFVMSPEGFKSRYTDRETAEIYAMVMAGSINTKIVGTLQSHGINAIGLSGFDGGLIRAERKRRLVIIDEKGRKVAIEGGYTGRITGINVPLLDQLSGGGYVPVISPLAMGADYEPLNIDGDRTAANVAAAMRADFAIYLTDVEGVIIDGKVLKRISTVDSGALLEKIGPGMSTKIHAAVEAVRGGVCKAVITSGLVDHPLSSALKGESGTVITP